MNIIKFELAELQRQIINKQSKNMEQKNNTFGIALVANILLIFFLFSCQKLDFRGFTKCNVDSIIVVNAVSVVANLNVLDLGPTEHPDYGICYSSTNPLPTIEDSALSVGSIKDCSKYNLKIESLNFGTKYYFRAYIMDNNVPVYSFNVKEVTMPNGPLVTTEIITSIKTTTANGGGNVISDGGIQMTLRGVCWSTNQNPTTSDNKTIDGSGRGKFTSTISAIEASTKYYVRAYSMNSLGTFYGNEICFISATPGLPTINTKSITSITQNSAQSGGEVISDGESLVSSRGVCWSKNQNPTILDNKTIDGSGIGNFSSNIQGLTLGTTYYLRAYAINDKGTSYGNQLSFTTASPEFPIVTTKTISSITQSSAISGGDVSSDGGSSVIDRGVCWDTNQNPSISNSKTDDGSGIGSYQSNISGLALGTKYYLRAYATNSKGTSYGSQISFTTTGGTSNYSGIREIAIIGFENVIYHWGKVSTNYPGQQFAGYGSFSDLSSLRADYAYTLHGSLTANDVVGVAIIQEGTTTPCYAWYANGTVSKGYSNDLDAYIAPSSYSLPSGKSTNDIIAIGINPTNSNRCYTWYSDGTYSIGELNDLDYYSGCQPFTYPGGSIVGIDFAYDGKVYTYYSEGNYSVGIANNLAYYGSGYSYKVTLQ